MEPEARARLERVAVANRQWADMWEAAGLEPDLQVASRHVGLDIDAALAEIDRPLWGAVMIAVVVEIA